MPGNKVTVVVVAVKSLSHVRLFVTPWTSACYAFLYFTISWSLLKFMCTESVMPFNHLILYCPFLSCPQSSPASGSFPMSQLFASGGQGRGASASASILPMNTQSWFLLGLTGLISLQSKGPPRAFSSTTVWKHQVIKYINVSVSSNLENNDGPWHELTRERCNITLGCSYACVLSRCSRVWLFVTPWTVAHQAPLSMGFSRQEYWSELPCPLPRTLPDPGIEPVSLMSPVLVGRFFTTCATQEALDAPNHPLKYLGDCAYNTFKLFFSKLTNKMRWLATSNVTGQREERKKMRSGPQILHSSAT